MTYDQAISVANERALNTGVKQRVAICDCDIWVPDKPTPHYRVYPVDRVPEGAL